MKKTIKILLVVMIAMLFIGYTGVVNATAAEDMISYLSQPFKVAGQDLYVSSAYIKEAQRYIDTYGITDAQVTIVKEKFSAGIAILDKAGVLEPAKLNKAQRQELLKLAQEAGSAVGATITYVDGDLIVKGPDGKVFGEYPVVDDNGNGTAHAFARTGNDVTLYIISGVAIIAIAGAVIYGKKKVNA